VTKNLQQQLQKNPNDTALAEQLHKGITHLGTERSYFIPPARGRARTYARATPPPTSEQPPAESNIQSDEEVEVDDGWRKRSDWREFETYWAEVCPELKELMRKEPAENMAVLKETCWQLYPTIKGMFLYYSALDVDVFLKLSRAQQKSVKEKVAWSEENNRKTSMMQTVSMLEFSQFLKDVEVLGDRKAGLNKADAELIFKRVNWERDESGNNAANDDNPDLELTGHEWLHSVIRVAHRLPKLQGIPTHERVQRCVQTVMLPKAGKVDMTDFEERFICRAVQTVLVSHEPQLRSLFSSYSRDAGEDGADAMDIHDLLKMCKALNVVNAFCPEEVILTTHVLAQRGVEADGADNGLLDFEEFQWAVSRIADLWLPDRYAKLSVKVQKLFVHLQEEMLGATSDPKTNEDPDNESADALLDTAA